MRLLLHTALAALLATSTAAPIDMGDDFETCTNNPGPFQIWINEMSFTSPTPPAAGGAAVDLSIATGTIEIAAVADAALRYSDYRLVLVADDGLGTAIPAAHMTVNIATACTRTTAAAADAAQPAIDLFQCTATLPLAAPLSGGVALVNTRGSTPVEDDVVVQYLITSRVVGSYMGNAGCTLPTAQMTHFLESADTAYASTQLVNAAGYDAATKSVDIYQWNWQGLLPKTYGTLNAGVSEFGEFGQSFYAVDLAPLPELPPIAGPAVTGTIACPLGDLTPWSGCIAQCTLDGAAATTGMQSRYYPLADTVTDHTACPSLAARTETRACTGFNPCPTATSDSCTNMMRDGAETDLNCGGGIADTFPAGSTASDISALITAGGVTQTLPAGTCPRCKLGSACTAHNDCSFAAGLMCLRNTCMPASQQSVVVFVHVNVTLRGIDLPEFRTDGALATYRETVAQMATTGAAPVTAVDVSIAQTLFFTNGVGLPATNQRVLSALGRGMVVGKAPAEFVPQAREAVGSSHGHGAVVAAVARQLALPGDALVITTAVAAPSEAAASVIQGALAINMNQLLTLLQERLRPYAPLLGGGATGQPAVVAVPAPGDTVPTVPPGGGSNGGGGGGITNPPGNNGGGGATTTDSGLSGGAIAGIVIGATVGALLLAGGVFAAYKRQQNRDNSGSAAATTRRRPGNMDIGDGATREDSTAARVRRGEGAGAGMRTEKAKFTPQQPRDATAFQGQNPMYDGSSATGAVAPPDTAVAVISPGDSSPAVASDQSEYRVGAMGTEAAATADSAIPASAVTALVPGHSATPSATRTASSEPYEETGGEGNGNAGTTGAGKKLSGSEESRGSGSSLRGDLHMGDEPEQRQIGGASQELPVGGTPSPAVESDDSSSGRTSP